MSPHRDDAESIHSLDSPTSNGVFSSTDRSSSRQSHHSFASPFLEPTDPDADLDLICVGFGPASLAIAVAMHDALKAGTPLTASGVPPKVLFIEKQSQFAWHAGMLLPGAKMQISFIKDLATLRDPRSDFTFLNYLHQAGRLVEFTNLGTFLPARVEYEDYLRWCASHFTHLVQYGHEVLSVSPEAANEQGSVRNFTVRSRDGAGKTHSYRSRHVLIAIGGQPSIPRVLPTKHARVIHSSQYAYMVPRILTDPAAPYRVTVIGAGQSAAEIFNNIQVLYPNSRTRLVMRSEFLRPSDDSPFVNSIFNPDYVDSIFNRPPVYRRNLLTEAKATNYSVVRLELIEQLYERMYEQRREFGIDETLWPHRIMGGWEVTDVQVSSADAQTLQLRAQRIEHIEGHMEPKNGAVGAASGLSLDDAFDADLVIAATGYQRVAHLNLLRDAYPLLPETTGLDKDSNIDGWTVDDNAKGSSGHAKKLKVGRDYRVEFAPGKVAPGSGVWLQGCCEGTHGLSDTLLSVLATRSGEIVQSMFGQREVEI